MDEGKNSTEQERNRWERRALMVCVNVKKKVVKSS